MNNSSSARQGHRLWFLVVVVVLAAGAYIYFQLQPELERNFRGWLTMALVVLVLLLTLIWFVLLTRFSPRTRWTALAVAVAAFFGLRALVRVDGSLDGRGLPRFTWKWTKREEVKIDQTAAVLTEVKTPDGATDVPQFYGPQRDGIVRGANLNRDWSSSPPKLLWQQPIGIGWSAFSVVGGRAYTQEQRGEDELVTCYELVSGKLLWSHANHVRFVEWQGGDGPRATPTVVDGRLFVMGATGILDCLDAVTGKLLWSRDALKENNAKNITWGTSSSPLVYDDRVLVTAGDGDASVLAFHKDTGALLWKSGKDSACYSSPVLATIAGKRVVVSLNSGSLSLMDAASGEMLLDETWKPGQFPKAAQPVILGDDRIFLTAGYGYGCVMFQIKAVNGKLAATELWSNNKLKAQFNSVALRDGFFYGLDDGALACMDVATGARKWKDGRFGSGQSLMVDDLLLIQSEPGAVVLAEAKPEGHHEVARLNALKNKTWNYPTLAGRYLLLRNDREVMCFELPVNIPAK